MMRTNDIYHLQAIPA